jgi:hypothetical protein
LVARRAARLVTALVTVGASPLVADSAYGTAGSGAERLRGRRFYLPLLALVAATVAGGIALNHTGSSAPPPPPTQDALAGVSPQARVLLDRLEADRLFCGALRATDTTTSCLFGATTTRTMLTTYADHRSVLRGLGRLEGEADQTFAQTRAVSYAIVGARWLITGLWSQTGHYNEGRTVDAQIAQSINARLNGCLELLPREASSCAL